jgi:hypothetical protein
VIGVRRQRLGRFVSPKDELPADGTKLLERVVERKMSAAAPVKRLGTSACPAERGEKAAVYVLDKAGYVKVRDWCKQQRLHQCRHQVLYQTWLSLKPPPPAESGSKPRLI